MRLLLIITTFLGMTGGCETDRFGNPVLLDDSVTPHRIESNCWYSVASSASLHIPAVIERPSVNEKLAIYWEELDESSSYTILFDWGGIPYYNLQQNTVRYNFFIDKLSNEGQTVFPISYRVQPDGNIHDVYHCADYTFGCSTVRSEPHTGDLYLKFAALGTLHVDVGRFKIVWEKQNSYIQPLQLQSIKNMWTSCCLPTFVHPLTKPSEIDTKIDFKNIFSKANCDWVLSSNATDTKLDLITTNSCEEIEHITCDGDGNVIGLYVANYGLKCDNFFQYVNFPKLETMLIGQNHLSGNIEEVSHLTSLTVVSAHDNYFSGKIPCFSNLDMKVLELGMNKIGGVIPECVGQLTNLNVFDMSHNPFNKQVFPHFLKMLSKLEILKMRNTNLNGNIDNVFNLPSLEVLDISSNYLTGQVPESLVQSKKLKYVDLSFNFLSGIIPKIGEAVVQAFYGMNSFVGDLLDLLVNAPFNLVLDISHNKFAGVVPDEVVKQILMRNLVVNMKGNKFECESGSETWSKSILRMNHVLNLGKCGNDVPNVPDVPVKPCPTYLHTNEVVDSDDNTKFIVAVVVLCLMSAACIFLGVYYFLVKRQGYKQTRNLDTSDNVEMIDGQVSV